MRFINTGTLTLLFTLFLRVEKSDAQQIVYRPDSIVYYQMFGLDTIGLQALKKIIYEYDLQFRPIVRNEYRFDRISDKWINHRRSTYQYIAQEVVIRNFSINMAFEQIPVDREILIYKIAPFQMLQKRRETYDSVNRSTTLRQQTLFQYEKDSLTHIDENTLSTTFYKSSQSDIKMSKQILSEEWKEFTELDGLVKQHHKRKYIFQKGQLTQKETLFVSDSNRLKTSVYVYDKTNKLIGDSLYTMSPRQKGRQYEQVIQYLYDKNDHLQEQRILQTDAKGKAKVSTNNQLIRYYCRKESPILIEPIGQYIYR